LATASAKKQIIQTGSTIIIPNMIGMGFCTGLLFSSEIETEVFSALVAELKEVLIQHRTTDLAVTALHLLPKKLED
jgi:hypothetical protein